MFLGKFSALFHMLARWKDLEEISARLGRFYVAEKIDSGNLSENVSDAAQRRNLCASSAVAEYS